MSSSRAKGLITSTEVTSSIILCHQSPDDRRCGLWLECSVNPVKRRVPLLLVKGTGHSVVYNSRKVRGARSVTICRAVVYVLRELRHLFDRTDCDSVEPMNYSTLLSYCSFHALLCFFFSIPLQAYKGPEDYRRLRLPDFKTIGTGRL